MQLPRGSGCGAIGGGECGSSGIIASDSCRLCTCRLSDNKVGGGVVAGRSEVVRSGG